MKDIDSGDHENDIPGGNQKEIPADLTHDVHQVTHSVQLDIYVEQLLAKHPREERVCATSDIKEVRIFSKRDILEVIASFAVANKIELRESEICRIVTNEQRTVVVLEVKVPSPDGSYQLINFTIKGRHGRDESGTTNLDRTFWDKDDMPEGGGVVAEYLEGKWSFYS